MKAKPVAPKGERKVLDKPRGGKVVKNKPSGPSKAKSQLNQKKVELSIQSAGDDLIPISKQKKTKLLNGSSGIKTKVMKAKSEKANVSPGQQKNKNVSLGQQKNKNVSPGQQKNKKQKKGNVDGELLGKLIETEIEKRFGNKGGAGKPEQLSPEAGGKKKRNRKKRKSSSGSTSTSEIESPKKSGPETSSELDSDSPTKLSKAAKKRLKRALKLKEEGQSTSKPAEQRKIDQSEVRKSSVKKQKMNKEPALKSTAAMIDHDTPIQMGSFPARTTVEKALNALLISEGNKTGKPALLGEDAQIMLEVDFFKVPKGAKSLQRILLPHGYLSESPDVAFISVDMKKAKDDFDESVEYHQELFKKHGVKGISTIIPWRKLSKEYSQFEEKRKLINSFDTFLLDARLSHRWPSLIRKKIAQRKAPIPVRLNEQLKKNIERALRKTTIILKTASSSVSPVVGHIHMPKKALVDNIITAATVLSDESRYPAGKANIRKLSLKTPKTEQQFVIYVSTASPNSVIIPSEKKAKGSVVVGEVSTAGVTVAVHPSGRVQIKSKNKDLNETEHGTSPVKQKKGRVVVQKESDEGESDVTSDGELDSSILNKFRQVNQASEDEDESEDDDEVEIEKAEQEFLQVLRQHQDSLEAKSKRNQSKKPNSSKKDKKAVGKQLESDSDEGSEEEEDGFEMEEDDLDVEEDIDDDDLEDDSEDDTTVTPVVTAKVLKAQANQAKLQQRKKQPKAEGKSKQLPSKKNMKQNGSQKKAGPQVSPKNQKGSKKGSLQLKAGKFNKKGGRGTK